MKSTNSIDTFRIVGPLRLGNCLAAELPVITLCSKGYVSSYDHEDVECGDRTFVTWNAIGGTVQLPGNPGQLLSRILDSILAERKKLDSWELDAWAEWTNSTDYGVPDEAIVISVDTSSSMGSEMPSRWLPSRNATGSDPSRLEEVKEFFKIFASNFCLESLHLSRTCYFLQQVQCHFQATTYSTAPQFQPST